MLHVTHENTESSRYERVKGTVWFRSPIAWVYQVRILHRL